MLEIEWRSRYLGSFKSMLMRSRIWPERNPSIPPMLHLAKDLIAARTDSGVTYNENTGREIEQFCYSRVLEGAWDVAQPRPRWDLRQNQ